MTIAIILSACGGEGSRALSSSAMERTAETGKSGTYLARGTFIGGEISDGRDVYQIEWSAQDGFERIKIRIHEARWGDSENSDPVKVPCRFTVSREDFPSRLLVVISGTRMFSAQPPELPEGAMFKGFYRIVYLDDAGCMFAFDVKSDTEFEVFEAHDPAEILIDVREVPEGSRGDPDMVFSLRSASWHAGERPGHFQERLMRAGSDKPRIIRDGEGYFFVEEGWYPVREKAEERQGLFAEKGMVLFIEERGKGDKPAHMPGE